MLPQITTTRNGEDANPPLRQVRAEFDETALTVYQAYPPQIADAAVDAGHFVPPFSLGRMTWIKPSFLWMMYRSGWATKPNQERILAVRITREGFEDALGAACLSHFDADLYASHDEWKRRLEATSVRVQWDPERSRDLQALSWRSLQVGLTGESVHRYVDEWIVGIDDITERVRRASRATEVTLPREEPYPLPPAVAEVIGAFSS